MRNITGKIGYRLVRNATPTSDKAPYLGVAVPVGSLAYDNILRRMIAGGTFMTHATAQYFLNEFFEFAAEEIADKTVRINTGAVSIYPMISGTFDSEDDTYREPRNALYVGATLSQEIRDAVSGMVPENLGDEQTASVRISSVMDLASETYRLIDGTKPFRIAGIDLTVPDGEDESLTLVATDGVTKVADITVVSTEDGQRIVCELASAVPKGTYNVRLVSHGLDPTAPLATILYRVTVNAGDEPVPMAQTSDGKCKIMSMDDEGSTTDFLYGSAWNVNGIGIYGDRAAPGGEWEIARCSVSVDGSDYTLAGNFNEDGTHGEISPLGGDTPARGTYHDVVLSLVASRGTESETLTITLPTFIVE